MRKTLLIKAILLLLALPLSQTMRAEDETVMCLLVTETDGTETYFALSDKPVISFADGAMTVTSSTLELTVALTGVVDYKLSSVPTGIKSTYATQEGQASFSGKKACITGLKAGAAVNVFTVDGVKVASVSASPNGEANVDFSTLKTGTVYLLSTPTVTYKIMNK